MGYRKYEKTDDVPNGFRVSNNKDPYPITIFGEKKTISDNKISNYLTEEFFYYNDIFIKNKLFGLPYKNWLDTPYWIIELHEIFEAIDNEYQNYTNSITK